MFGVFLKKEDYKESWNIFLKQEEFMFTKNAKYIFNRLICQMDQIVFFEHLPENQRSRQAGHIYLSL